MKKNLILIACMLLWAPLAAAQVKAPPAGPQVPYTVLDVYFAPGYRLVEQDGNTRSGEYEYLHSSAAGSLEFEWDPLPQRFRLESGVNNARDYYNELDYAYSDIVMLNVLSRRFFHNLDHYSFGTDDPATASPSFTDRDPLDRYGADNSTSRFFMRLKTPDFPFHLYGNARILDNHLTMQQRFLNAFSGGYNRISQTRSVDWETEEATVGANSHLGPVEIDYSHLEKKFTAARDNILTDAFVAAPGDYQHNLAPDLESSSDTVKIHTSHTGRIAAAATYSVGDKENKDSGTKAAFVNAAGDLTLIPWKNLTMTVKYRHYDVNLDTPDTVTTTTPAGVAIYDVRNGIISRRDTVSGTFRFRATDRLTLRGEYAWESLFRNVWPGYDAFSSPPNTPAYWTLDQRVTKGTAKLGATYRLTNRITARADVSHQSATIPSNSVDNTYFETADSGRASLSWAPARWLNVLLSGGTIIEERDNLAAPLAGSRKSQRDRALANVTVLAGKQASVTASYAYFGNRMETAIAYPDAIGTITAETGVPYADTAHVASLSATYAATDAVALTAEAGRTWSRGGFRISEVVPGSAGIPQLSNLKVTDSTIAALVEINYTRNFGTGLRYQYRRIDDQLDNTQDGTTQVALATLTLKW